jgi:fructoselysine 6-kinase
VERGARVNAALSIAAVGEICADLYEGDDQTYLGGISANFARSAAAAGARAVLFAAIGDDALGARLEALVAESPEPRIESRVRVLPGATAVQRIRVATDGERIFCGFDAGVVTAYELTDAELADLARFDAIAVPLATETEHVVRQLGLLAHRALIGDVSRDSAGGDLAAWLASRLGSLAIAFVGGTAADLEPLRVLSERTKSLVVLTAGPAGAWALASGHVVHQPSIADRVVDTTGCGDAFQGAFTVSHLEGAPLEIALLAGARAAARVAAKRGAGP